MIQIPDHPVIRNMMRAGTPDGKASEYPVCPVCGSECDTVYRQDNGEIVGCEECLHSISAWEASECFPGKDEE